MYFLLGIILILLLKATLDPLQHFSVAFVIYKSAVMLVTWLLFILTAFEVVEVPDQVVALFGIAAVLFSLPKLMIAREAIPTRAVTRSK